MEGILGRDRGGPWHSTPYAALPLVHVQNASLEIAWSRVVLEDHTIAGTVVMPFHTEGAEGFDLNHPEDWVLAEYMLRERSAQLPEVDRPPWTGDRTGGGAPGGTQP
jgi:CMP-N,N'-diacetyllegionaminic acid synthase